MSSLFVKMAKVGQWQHRMVDRPQLLLSQQHLSIVLILLATEQDLKHVPDLELESFSSKEFSPAFRCPCSP